MEKIKNGICFAIALALTVVFHTDVAAEESPKDQELEQCIAPDSVFVNEVTTVRGERVHELIRYGTCDSGDPINIEYVDREVVKTIKVPYSEYAKERMNTDAGPGKGGDANYKAVLTVKY